MNIKSKSSQIIKSINKIKLINKIKISIEINTNNVNKIK